MSRTPVLFSSEAIDDTNLPGPSAVADRRHALGRVRIWAVAVAALSMAAAGAQAQPAFGTVALGTPSSATITVTAQAAGTVSSIQVLTAGASALDFTPGSGTSTCTGATLSPSQNCTVSVTFTPLYPGLRMGAAILLDGSGNLLGTALFSGVGQGGLGVLVAGNLIDVAGNGYGLDPVEDGIPATSAELDQPSSVVLDGSGNMYIADSAHNRIRMVSASTGLISTIAGSGKPGYGGDGSLATDKSVTFNSPYDIAMDGAGNLYIADSYNSVIRKITAATGIIATVAGNGTLGSAGDGGAATAAELNYPRGVTVDGSGNLFIADTANHRIRRVDAVTGIITTIAGKGIVYDHGVGADSGDGGPAVDAELNFPYAVAFDLAGNMYIPDSGNNVIRIVNPAGIIDTFAGTRLGGYLGDGGPATAAELDVPQGVITDPAGNVYIADTQSSAIRKVSATTGIITSIAQNGAGDYLSYSNFYQVSIYWPMGMFMDGAGNLYFADNLNLRIREIQSNFIAVDLTQTPVRQGDTSAPSLVTVENDGNGPLDLTGIVPDANAAYDPATTTCNTGSPLLAVNGDCVIGVEFAPSVAGNPLDGNVDVTDALPNSPLDIRLVGDATPVNSTTVAVSSNNNPSYYGQSVTLTATVTTGSGTGSLTGTITFMDGGTTLQAGVALNSSNAASFTSSSFAVGSHSITASYSGDTLHFPNTSPAYSQVVYESTITKLASGQNPSVLGASVTFTATVTSPSGAGAAPDGTVTFTNNGTTLGTRALNASGVATYSTSTLPRGLNPILATYSGDPAKFIPGSISSVFNQDVQAGSTTVVTSSQSTAYYGNPVTFTATVTTEGAVPATGTANILDGGQKIGTANLAGTTGIGTFTTSSLAVGSHSITAQFAGDINSGSSTSLAITQQVNQTETATTVAALPTPGIAGAPVAVTATVQVVDGATTPTGTVTFASGTTALPSGTVGTGGKATIDPVFTPGSYQIVATYAGDTDDGGSVSAAYPLTVQIATTTTLLTSSANPSLVQSPVTFTAKVTGNGGIPTGSVSFLVDGTAAGAMNLDATGTAVFTTSALTAGNHQVTASYAGDTNDSPDTSNAVAQVVTTIPTITDLGVSTTTGSNPQAILVAVVLGAAGPTPTGTVTFSNGNTVVGTSPLDASGVATLTPNLANGTFSIVAAYGGDPLHSPSTSGPVTVVNPPTGFSLTVTPAAVTLATTQNTTVSVDLVSNAGFTDTIGLGCASLPAGVTCHFASLSTKLAANANQAVQLTIDTNSPLSGGASAMNAQPGARGTWMAGLFLPLGIFFGWIVWRFRKRHAAVFALMLVLLLSGAAMLVTGCSGFTQTSAAPGTYVIQVVGVGASSNITHYQNVTLTITK
jgi:sugar lactone lactonase YvrE